MPKRRASNGRPSTARPEGGWPPALIGLLVALSLLLAGTPAQADTTGFPTTPTTYEGFDYGVAGHPATADKPQSKLWFADGSWWAVMISVTNAKRVNVFELTRDHTWRDTGVTIDDRTTSTADVLYEDGVLYTASRASSSDVRVNRLRYAPATRTWQQDPGFPVSTSPGGSESATIARDSLGRLWVTYTRNKTVWVQRSTGTDHQSWTAPFTPGTVDVAIGSDDLSAIVSLGSKIGVMWSNQVADRFLFAVHSDTAPDAQWSLESPLAGTNLADDHVNLKTFGADDQGRTFAVVKTSLDDDPSSPQSAPLIVVLARSAAGAWTSTTFGTIADDHTRPMLVVDETHQELNVFATGSIQGGSIYRKKAPLSDVRFAAGRGEPFVTYPGAYINNATSTKDPVNARTGLVVLAAAHGSTPRYYHTELALGSGTGGGSQPPPPQDPPPSGGIAFRAASTAQNGGASSITVATPSGIVAGDVLLATIDVRGRPSITASAGWQLVRHDDGGSTMQKATYWKAATSGEPAGYTFGFSSSAGATALVSAYSGVSTTAPIDTHSGSANAASAQITAPAVTTTVPGTRLVGLFAIASSTSITPPSGMTERAEATAATSTYKITGETADTALSSAGSTGPRVATASRSTKNIGQLIALRPSADGGGGGDGGAADTTEPSTPMSVTASATSSTSAQVGWVASTDDTGVTGYEVRRDGTAVGTPTTTSWSDTSLSPGTAYAYTVVAVDAAGNRSAASAPAQVTTPAAESPLPQDPPPSDGIAFRAASSAHNGGADSITVPNPSGIVAGDVLLATIDVRGRPTITAPAGWQLVRHDDGGTTMQKVTYWKVAAAGEPANHTFGLSYGAGATALISAYSGVSTTAPIDAHAGLVGTTASKQITAPAITTTVPGTRLVGLFATASSTAIAPPTGMTERAEAAATTSTYKITGELADTLHSTTGSTRPRVATADASAKNIGQLIALRPAA